MAHWSDSELDLLAAGFRRGLSASEVSDGLVKAGFARRTRSAVLGKRWRLGLALDLASPTVPASPVPPKTVKVTARAACPVARPAALPGGAPGHPARCPAKPKNANPAPPAPKSHNPSKAPASALQRPPLAAVPPPPTPPSPPPALPLTPPAGAVRLTDAGDRACRTPVAEEGAELYVCGAETPPRQTACPACRARLRRPTAPPAGLIWFADRAGRALAPKATHHLLALDELLR